MSKISKVIVATSPLDGPTQQKLEEIPTTQELSQSDQIEQKIWNIVQGVPGLNVGYGSIRLVVYISKGNKDEALRSALGVAKGIVQSAAIAGSAFIGPIVTPLAAGALTGIVTETIQGAAHVVIFIIEHSGELRKKLPDAQEKMIFEEVKESPAMGAVYASVRAPIYAIKGDMEELKYSGTGAVSGSVMTAINYGLNVVPGLDEEGKSFIQKISQSIIQLLSRKVLEDVSKKRMSLEEGIHLVKTVEEKCDTLEIITLQNENEISAELKGSDEQSNQPSNDELSLDISVNESIDCMTNEGSSSASDKTNLNSDKKSRIKATLKQLSKLLNRETKQRNDLPLSKATLVSEDLQSLAADHDHDS